MDPYQVAPKKSLMWWILTFKGQGMWLSQWPYRENSDNGWSIHHWSWSYHGGAIQVDSGFWSLYRRAWWLGDGSLCVGFVWFVVELNGLGIGSMILYQVELLGYYDCKQKMADWVLCGLMFGWVWESVVYNGTMVCTSFKGFLATHKLWFGFGFLG